MIIEVRNDWRLFWLISRHKEFSDLYLIAYKVYSYCEEIKTPHAHTIDLFTNPDYSLQTFMMLCRLSSWFEKINPMVATLSEIIPLLRLATLPIPSPSRDTMAMFTDTDKHSVDVNDG